MKDKSINAACVLVFAVTVLGLAVLDFSIWRLRHPDAPDWEWFF